MKKAICLLLCFITLVNVFAVSVGAAAVDDYTQWKQWDSEWNATQAWPTEQYPYATLHYMSDAGCLVTAVATLLRHHNVVMDGVNEFNPRICCDRLKEVGAFDSSGGLLFAKVEDAYPGFVFEGFRGYSLDTLKELFNNGYACILRVDGSDGYDHYVAVQDIVGDNVYLMNPGTANSTLAELGSAYEIVVYKPTPAEYVGCCQYYPSYCKIKTVDKKTYAMTQPCSSGTDSSSVYVETIPANTILYTYGVYMNTAGNLWYKVLAPQSCELVYIPSSHTEFLRAEHDVKIKNISAPAKLDTGACFSLGGSITSLHTDLKQVSAYVYSGGNTSGTALTGKTVDVTGESYDLYNSAVDYGTKFNELPSGRYMYVVRATVDGTYYAESEKVLAKTEPEELTIYKGSFVVGDVEEEIVKETMEIAEEAVKEIKEKTPETTPQPKETASNKLAVLRKILKLFF